MDGLSLKSSMTLIRAVHGSDGNVECFNLKNNKNREKIVTVKHVQTHETAEVKSAAGSKMYDLNMCMAVKFHFANPYNGRGQKRSKHPTVSCFIFSKSLVFD